MKLHYLYLLPLLIYVIILATGFTLTSGIHEYIMRVLRQYSLTWADQNAFLSFLFQASSVLTWVILKLSTFILLGIISGYATLILLSPVYTWLSERVYSEVTGVILPFNLSKFIKDVIRAVIIASRNGAIQLLWTIFLFGTGFVPILNLIAAPLLFVVTAYFYGFSFLDYAHEQQNLTMGQSIKAVRKLKYAATSLGGVFLFCYMIPWLGSFLASLISFHLVISATLTAVKKESSRQ